MKRRPPLSVVLGAIAATIALLISVNAVAGRLVWTW